MPNAPGTFKGGNTQALTNTQKGYDSHWRKISKLYRQRNPICEACNEEQAQDTDHIKPFRSKADQRRTDWDNLQALCRKCHNTKTRYGGWVMDVTFVTGVSGSGKSTYVRDHSQPGDLVWDMDTIAGDLIDGMGRKADRPSDLLYVLYGMRQVIIKGLRLGTINRPAWVIWSDEQEARKHAPPHSKFVRCSR